MEFEALFWQSNGLNLGSVIKFIGTTVWLCGEWWRVSVIINSLHKNFCYQILHA